VRTALQENEVLFHIGITRSASAILAEQKVATSRQNKLDNLCRMRHFAHELFDSLQARDLAGSARRSMAAGISSGVIDD